MNLLPPPPPAYVPRRYPICERLRNVCHLGCIYNLKFFEFSGYIYNALSESVYCNVLQTPASPRELSHYFFFLKVIMDGSDDKRSTADAGIGGPAEIDSPAICFELSKKIRERADARGAPGDHSLNTLAVSVDLTARTISTTLYRNAMLRGLGKCHIPVDATQSDVDRAVDKCADEAVSAINALWDLHKRETDQFIYSIDVCPGTVSNDHRLLTVYRGRFKETALIKMEISQKSSRKEVASQLHRLQLHAIRIDLRKRLKPMNDDACALQVTIDEAGSYLDVYLCTRTETARVVHEHYAHGIAAADLTVKLKRIVDEAKNAIRMHKK